MKKKVIFSMKRKGKRKILKLYEVRFSEAWSIVFKFIRSILILLASCAVDFGDQSDIKIIIVFTRALKSILFLIQHT